MARFGTHAAGRSYSARRRVRVRFPGHAEPPDMLKLRMIGQRDYSVVEDGQRIGRIRFAAERERRDLNELAAILSGPI